MRHGAHVGTGRRRSPPRGELLLLLLPMGVAVLRHSSSGREQRAVVRGGSWPTLKRQTHVYTPTPEGPTRRWRCTPAAQSHALHRNGKTGGLLITAKAPPLSQPAVFITVDTVPSLVTLHLFVDAFPGRSHPAPAFDAVAAATAVIAFATAGLRRRATGESSIGGPGFRFDPSKLMLGSGVCSVAVIVVAPRTARETPLLLVVVVTLLRE